MELATIATLTSIEGMDSRDIAALTGKRHDNVLRDIKSMLEEMEIGELKFEGSYLSEQNKEMKCYILPKRECLILASGYNVKLRAAIVDRWAELESAKKPLTRIEMLKQLLEAEEQAEQMRATIELQRPAVEFFDRFVDAKQTQNIRAVAKVLGVKERDFISALLEHGVLYRLNKRLTPKADMMKRGLFEVKEFMSKGGYACPQMLFTTAGVEWVSHKVQEWGIAK